ncbi:MAG: acetyl-CoA carboxylase biotin carboxylase subunit [Oscillospiraceae bacterium]|jgi:acetyl-CoA carboxylase biotin carboxylase subunit|nr:acetyl-CoA carboxylase biotin carboxylase subunit [Oscillospiraceae bacterium]
MKILIANRGEIAVRIIRACRELGMHSVAVYSTADRAALHTIIADESVCIGPPQVSQSYLNIKNVLAACEITGAEFLHPGFGFLSENATFADLCKKCGVTFIGPPSDVITLLGDKANAKETMKKAGVPVIPGSDGAVKSLEEAKKIAKEMGFPILIKAAAGGGGRGIRRVDNESELEHQIIAAKEESKKFFGDDSIYIEKLLLEPKHIEFQILADSFGNVVHLGERDCSLQRRRQKVLEETPSPVMTPELREKMGNAAVSAAKASGYVNAGTIEFLVDKNSDFYFMEMNTRIQVEHPITEYVTGVDLVKEQIRIAMGQKLSVTQEDIELNGHSIECRINAEKPTENFRPSCGKITALNLPGGNGVRIDSAIYQGYDIPPFYDNMLAKLIVKAPNRQEAIMKMKRALSEFIIDGVDTNIDFQLDLLRMEEFEKGAYNNETLQNQ